MRVSYIPDYYVELASGHPFPMGKFLRSSRFYSVKD